MMAGAEACAPSRYDFGPQVHPGAGATFRLWAPAQRAVLLRIAGRGAGRRMRAHAGGWHELDAADAQPGDRYAFELDDGRVVPDPASRFQPDDVHGWSELVQLPQSALPWNGRAWEEVVLYELHVGAFTPAG